MANGGTVVIKIDGDVKELEQELKKAEQTVEKLGKKISDEYKKAGTSQESSMKKAWSETEKASESGSNKVSADADKIEKSAKSMAASLAADYRKAGLSQSEAMRKAWSEIERSSTDGSKKVSADADKIGKSFDKIGKNISGVAAKGLGVLAGATAALTVAAGSALTGLAAIGVKYNADMEMYTSNFKVMLGSQEAAVKKVAELKEFAAKTPFGMQDLAESTKTLLAFQVPAEQATDTLKMLGDISLGNSEKLKSLSLVFGQVSSAGRLTGQDLLQFINQGFNPLNEIAKTTGESMEELRDRMSKGGVSAQEVSDALKSATSEGGQFYKGMEEAAKTTQGLLSTLKDDTQALIGTVFLPISESIGQKLLPEVLSYIKEMSTAFESEGVDGLITAAGRIVASMVTEIAAGAPQFIDSAIEIVNSFINGISENSESIANSGMSIVSSLLNGIFELFPNIAVTALDLLFTFLQGIIENVPQLISGATAIVSTLIQYLLENIPLIIETAIQLIIALIQGILEALPQIIAAAPQIVIALVTGIIGAIPVLITGFTQLVNAILNFFKSIVTKFVDVGKNIVTGIWNGIKSGWGWLIDSVKSLANSLLDGVKNVFGIRSPSVRFEEEVGLMIPAGAAKGIKKGTPDVMEVARKMLDFGQLRNVALGANLMGARGAVSRTSSTTHNTIDHGITQVFNAPQMPTPGEAYIRALSAVNRRAGFAY